MSAPLPDAAPLNLHRPFRRADALAAGITARQLRGPHFRRVVTGVYVAARMPDRAWVRAAAALLCHPPGAVATHTSSARVLGAPVPPDPVEHVTVAKDADRRPSRAVRCHVAALAAADVAVVDTVRISAPPRMFREVAGLLPLVEAVVVGDWLCRHGHATPAALVAASDGCPRAQHAASYVRERVDSPMESRVRMLLVLAGLPEPVVNAELRDEHGFFVARIDLSWPHVRLAVEYDGRQHVESAAQWERDVDRLGDVDELGWRTIRVTSRGVYRTPEDTLKRVWRALVDRGVRCPPPNDAWRPHFRH
jgi:hypothetical protein